MKTRTPPKLTPSIIAFCKSIVSGQDPLYVLVEPIFGQPVNECFSIVPKHVITYGGKQIIGWYIGEWPKVMIEAVFHTIWQSEDGRFIDITPKTGIDKILFIPDPGRKYEGRQVDNIRKPLTGDKRIKRYCDLSHRLFLARNEGDLAYQVEIPYTPTMQKIENEMAQLYMALLKKYG